METTLLITFSMVACHSGESPVVGMVLKIWTQFTSFSKLPHPQERDWLMFSNGVCLRVLRKLRC